MTNEQHTMKNWTDIVKKEVDAACSYSVLTKGRPYWKKAIEGAWNVWQEAVLNGWDSSKMSPLSTELDRFNDYVNGVLNEGF